MKVSQYHKGNYVIFLNATEIETLSKSLSYIPSIDIDNIVFADEVVPDYIEEMDRCFKYAQELKALLENAKNFKKEEAP